MINHEVNELAPAATAAPRMSTSRVAASFAAYSRDANRSSSTRACNDSVSSNDHRFASPSSSSPASMHCNAASTGCIPGDINELIPEG